MSLSKMSLSSWKSDSTLNLSLDSQPPINQSSKCIKCNKKFDGFKRLPLKCNTFCGHVFCYNCVQQKLSKDPCLNPVCMDKEIFLAALHTHCDLCDTPYGALDVKLHLPGDEDFLQICKDVASASDLNAIDHQILDELLNDTINPVAATTSHINELRNRIQVLEAKVYVLENQPANDDGYVPLMESYPDVQDHAATEPMELDGHSTEIDPYAVNGPNSGLPYPQIDPQPQNQIYASVNQQPLFIPYHLQLFLPPANEISCLELYFPPV